MAVNDAPQQRTEPGLCRILVSGNLCFRKAEVCENKG